MSEQEKFLDRWSRRKQEAEKADSDKSAGSPPENAGVKPAPVSAENATRNDKPEFDVSTLPSLDSIAAGTDIKAFLSAGVPAHLTRAALRNAWAADPAIRDFVGLSENAWDFNDPNSIPGFGTIDSPGELRRMAEHVFREIDKAAEEIEALTESPEEVVSVRPEERGAAAPDSTEGEEHVPEAPLEAADTPLQNLPRLQGDAWSQIDEQAAETAPAGRKRHGSALPT